VLVVGYLAEIQLIPRLTAPDGGKYATYTDTASIIATATSAISEP
jgi:hypothetical protein